MLWWQTFLTDNSDEQETGKGGRVIDPDNAYIFPWHGDDSALVTEGAERWHEQYGKEPTLVRSLLSIATWWGDYGLADPVQGDSIEIFVGLQVRNINIEGTGIVSMTWNQMVRQVKMQQGFIFSGFGRFGRYNRRLIADHGVSQVDLKTKRKIKEDELLHVWIGASPGTGLAGETEPVGFDIFAKFLLMTP